MATNTIHTTVADIMAGLMMVFLFIAIAFMLEQEAITKEVRHQNRAMTEIAEIAERSRQNLHQALRRAFAQDFVRWNVQLLKDNTVRFKAPDILFKTNKATLKPGYRTILQDFFPNYVAILYAHREEIQAIRIEGHTSSHWKGTADPLGRFFQNLKLSQERARNTLEYSLRLIKNPDHAQWLQKVLMSTGRSSGQPLYYSGTKTEDPASSRRVEFKIITKAEERLYLILKQAKSVTNP